MKQEQLVADIDRRRDIVQRVRHIVAVHLGDINEEVIFSKGRQREIVVARQVVQYLLKSYTKWSLASIGSLTGGRDHATVMHAIKTIGNLKDTEKQFKETMISIEKEVKVRAITAKRNIVELVLLESPYYSEDESVMKENVKFAEACMRNSLMRGEAPMASHLLYTRVLDEDGERSIGMSAAMSWQTVVDKLVVYSDRGITDGMTESINLAVKKGLRIEYRTLYDNESW